jgi:hypothetical protein
VISITFVGGARDVRGAIGATALALAFASPAFAEQVQAGFTVGVVVPARVVLDIVEQPAELTLTAEDIARGYKDVPARYRVHHNDRSGYTVRIAVRADTVDRVELHGLGEGVELNDGVVELRRAGDPFEQDLAFEVRLVLGPSNTPGVFDLKVEVSASPVRRV